MKAALYVLAGVVAVLGVACFGVLLAWAGTALFGGWGLVIQALLLLALGGGYVGWSVYQMRLTAAARDADHARRLPGQHDGEEKPRLCGVTTGRVSPASVTPDRR